MVSMDVKFIQHMIIFTLFLWNVIIFLLEMFHKNIISILVLEGYHEKIQFKSVCPDMSDEIAQKAVNDLSNYLSRYYGKKVIIILDEYDTPMQEAYVSGYWDELVAFTRSLFNLTFKTNPYLERGIMTGITTAEYSAVRKFASQTSNGSALAETISKESIFSDLNNLVVVTTTSNQYNTAFGFTEEEVFNALDEQGLSGDIESMNEYMNRVTRGVISYFDTGKTPSDEEPERFYHGLVLGLMVDQVDNYILNSNRESGFGRYDIMLEPIDKNNGKLPGIVIEFKVFNQKKEDKLEETVENALRQIKEKDYDAELIKRGVKEENIRHYGFAFRGKEVLIDGRQIFSESKIS